MSDNKNESEIAPTSAEGNPASSGDDVVSSSLQVINWDEAMNQVGGDEEFLDEVLADLITEAQTAQEDLQGCITGRDFDGVMKAAHRIKGSTSYLCCEVMKEISLTLQLAGHEGQTVAAGGATDELWVRVETLFAAYVKSFGDLQAEIEKRKAASSA